jgi:hypothetical protein
MKIIPGIIDGELVGFLIGNDLWQALLNDLELTGNGHY